MRRAVVVWLAVFLPGLALGDGVIDVSGRVLDADGEGVPDVRVSRMFTGRVGTMAPSAPARTDASGRYRLRIHLHGGVHALMAIGVDERFGGVAPLHSGVDLQNVDVTLQRLGTVRGTLLCEDLGGRREAELFVLETQRGATIANTAKQLGPFTLRLPPGRYGLKSRASVDHATWSREVTVVADEVLNLGEVMVAGAPHTKHLGLAPPAWSVAAARNLTLPKGRDPATVKEEDFDGRWLVVGFVDVRSDLGRIELTGLNELWTEQKAHRDRLAVVAFHAPWAKSFAQVEARVGKLPVSIPLFLDPSGKTHQSWGIGSEPRILLLDPEGRLQRFDRRLLFERLSR